MRAIAVAIAGSLVASVLVIGAASPANAASEISDVGATSLQQVASCVAQSNSLLVAIVVDESGSLGDTDKDNVRVEAIRTALGSLENLATEAGGAVAVHAELAVFGGEYTPIVTWAPIEDPAFRLKVDALKDKNAASYTNYVAALRGAQQSINGRASLSDIPDDTCKLVLWFTDGKLDIDDKPKDRVPEKNAVSLLCPENGIVDDLRADNIATVALALFDEAKSDLEPADKSLLRAIAEGQADGVIAYGQDDETTCGTVPIPAGWSNGAYLRAANADALRAVFAQAGALIEGGVQSPDQGCFGESCTGGELTVTVDPGVSRVRVVIEGDSDSPLTITAPDHAPKIIARQAPGTVSEDLVGGTDVSTKFDEGLTTVEIKVASDFGDWKLKVGNSEARVYHFWDARLLLELSADSFLIGQPNRVDLSLESLVDGKDMNIEDYDEFTVTASAEGADVEVSSDSDSYALTVTLEGDAVPSEVTLTVDATASTKRSGIPLGPITTKVKVATKLPPEYPTFAPAKLDFGDLIGETESSAELTLTGSDRGETQACFFPGHAYAPKDAKTTTVVASEDCVTLGPNESHTVTFTLNTENPADGRVSGQVIVELSGDDAAAEVVRRPVDFEASMVNPPDPSKQFWYTVGFVALAILLAWLTALIGRHFADRFRFGPHAQYCAVDVEITPEGPSRDGRATGELLDPVEDFQRVSTIGSDATTTSKDIAGLQYRRKSPLNPWRSAKGVVYAPGRIVTSGEHAETVNPDGSMAPVRFPGTTDFLLVADPRDISKDRASAQLVMVLDAPNGVSALLPDRLAELRQVHWPAVLTALNDAAHVRSERSASDQPKVKWRGKSHPEASPAHPAADNFTGSDNSATDAPIPTQPAQDWLLGDEDPPTNPARTGETGRPGRKRRERPNKSKPDKTQGPSSGEGTPPPPTDFL